MRLFKSADASDSSSNERKGRHSLISRYMVVFDEVINNKDARNCFKRFLKEETHSEEALLFLEDMKSYKNDYHNTKVEFEKDSFERGNKSTIKMVYKLYDQAKRIVYNYIDTIGVKELNLGHFKSTITKNWAKIDYHFKSMFPDQIICDTASNTSNSASTSKNLNTDIKDGLTQLFLMLEPTKLFDSCEVNIILDLKLDQFPLFSRSKLLDNFLIEMGETFTRSIAIDVSKGRNIDVRYKPKDFESRLLTDKDIYFAFALCEDTPDWRLCLQEEGLCLYYSKTVYSFGTSNPHALNKYVLSFPYPLEKVYSVFSDRESRLKIDEGMMSISHAMTYRPPHHSHASNNKAIVESVTEEREQFYDEDQPPLALTLGCFGMDLKLPCVKKRFCWFSETTIYDPYADCIVTVGHSTRSFSHPDEQELTRGKVLIDILYCNLFIRMNENTTRFIQTSYFDPKLPITDGFIINASLKSRARHFRKNFLKLLETIDDNSPILQADSFQSKKAIADNQLVYPGRSWFQEYESRKKGGVTLNKQN
ncbi:hypothetical protein FDP41_012992 [Naegleria fowleri]|uniref:RGS domain-containing protein n=1 Tax=Naegleria fowleri TaxID=5763 RepID=A0A6A5C3Y0_NAEFO|nr:uncharacterized protein FDP41_012992 [Naegleria fowleri]KAF0981204.1 hypothetical protein FDP41_012992 [Naegleria fowleri]CAG4712447.1 unnamed protein product [Naegleria fowleri]